MDGHPRQNPAYRPATEKAPETGLSLYRRFAGDSSGSPRGGLDGGSTEPLGAGRAATPARSPTPGAQSPFLEMKRDTIEADDADLHEGLRVLGLALA